MGLEFFRLGFRVDLGVIMFRGELRVYGSFFVGVVRLYVYIVYRVVMGEVFGFEFGFWVVFWEGVGLGWLGRRVFGR